jgi:WD40 repeat-containing protein SMU1
LELIESKEISTAKILLRKSNVLRLMSEDYPERYQIIQDYLEQSPMKQLLYTSEERRSNISKGKINAFEQRHI